MAACGSSADKQSADAGDSAAVTEESGKEDATAEEPTAGKVAEMADGYVAEYDVPFGNEYVVVTVLDAALNSHDLPGYNLRVENISDQDLGFSVDPVFLGDKDDDGALAAIIVPVGEVREGFVHFSGDATALADLVDAKGMFNVWTLKDRIISESLSKTEVAFPPAEQP